MTALLLGSIQQTERKPNSLFKAPSSLTMPVSHHLFAPDMQLYTVSVHGVYKLYFLLLTGVSWRDS